ncbi:MAG: cytochrome P450 [Solirubrobacterales bacterium]
MDQTLTDVPRLRRPALVNAAQYWLAPEQFARHCQRLGDRFLVPMPATGPWLCLTDPEDIKRIFTADTGVLALGAALAKASAHHLFLGPTGLTNIDGAEHMRRRRTQLPPFHGDALSGYHETMQRKTEEVLARWPYGHPTPSQPHMEAISLEVIMATVFGVTDPARVDRLRSATLALLREGHSRRFFLQTIIATSRENGWDRPFPRVRRAIDAVDAIVLEEVAQRRGSNQLDGQDVLGMFLRTPDSQGCLMSDEEICDAMRTLLLGGHDTTASTLTWILERVSRYPDALTRLQTAALDGDDEYLEAVIKEAMRLRPAFPLTARLATEPFELPGLTIPSGTMVVPYITLVHRRPELYPDPLTFRPERFLDTRAGTYTWIPFGGGPRRCIGAAFSLTEARIVLRTILRHARLQPSRRRAERVAHRNVFIVPARGGRITLQPRKPPPRQKHGDLGAREPDRGRSANEIFR